jgi:hypothetical protein
MPKGSMLFPSMAGVLAAAGQVDRILQPGGERFYGAVGVVAGPVEPPVDGALDPAPDRSGSVTSWLRGASGSYGGPA